MARTEGKKYTGQDRWCRDLADIIRITGRPSVGKDTRIDGEEVVFDEVMLLDLLRRREQGTESDGLRSRSYDGGGAGGSSDSTPTERAALRGLPEPGATNDDGELLVDDWRNHVQPDPVGKIIEEGLSALAAAAIALRKFENKLSIVLNVDAALKGRQNPIECCVVCERPVAGNDRDRLHRGRYCEACHKAWERAGRPGANAQDILLARDEWESKRRAEFYEAGKLWSQIGKKTFIEVDELDALVSAGSLPAKSA